MIDMRLSCIGCDADLPDDERAITREWCSQKCRTRYRRQLAIEARRNRPPCEYCGMAIPPELRAGVIYCNDRCQRLHYNQILSAATLDAKQDRPPCTYCGGEIPTKRRADAIYCGRACHIKASNKARNLRTLKNQTGENNHDKR